MRNKFLPAIVLIFFLVSKIFADTTSVVVDSPIKPFTPPDRGPLGIDINTGIALYIAAILFAVLVIAIWRKSIISRRNKSSIS